MKPSVEVKFIPNPNDMTCWGKLATWLPKDHKINSRKGIDMMTADGQMSGYAGDAIIRCENKDGVVWKMVRQERTVVDMLGLLQDTYDMINAGAIEGDAREVERAMIELVESLPKR